MKHEDFRKLSEDELKNFAWAAFVQNENLLIEQIKASERETILRNDIKSLKAFLFAEFIFIFLEALAIAFLAFALFQNNKHCAREFVNPVSERIEACTNDDALGFEAVNNCIGRVKAFFTAEHCTDNSSLFVVEHSCASLRKFYALSFVKFIGNKI